MRQYIISSILNIGIAIMLYRLSSVDGPLAFGLAIGLILQQLDKILTTIRDTK